MGWLLAAIAAAVIVHAHSKASVDTPSGTTAQTGGTQVVPLAQIPDKGYISTGFNPTAEFFLRWTKASIPVAPSTQGGSAPYVYNPGGQAVSQPGGSGTGGVGGGGNQAPGGGFGGPSGRGFI